MRLKINGKIYTNDQLSDNTQTLIQACETFGFSIPRFCYHQKLSIAGNCRMCLVEVENAVKPVASCAVVQMPNMSIFTDSAVTKKAREAVMEFLLLNHPLDCPICDQGGECDLQDQSLLFGNDRSRFYGYKRAVANKNVGPLVKMVMTRCIHCTRCVRFASDIAGVQDLGVTGRGSAMEIGTYIEKAMKSELSGNVIDLCPVGALTSKPYAFTARPWEVQSVDSIDTSDSLGSNITVQVIGSKIMRVLPKANDSINGDWITDRARFSYDGITSLSRELEPSLYINLNQHFPGQLESTFSPEQISDLRVLQRETFDDSFKMALIGEGSDVEELVKFKIMYNRNYNLHQTSRPDLVPFFSSENLQSVSVNSDFRHLYRLNTFLTNLNKASFTLVVGSDLRTENPIIHSLISSRLRTGDFSVNYIGSFIDSKIGMSQLGNTVGQLYNLFNGTSWICHPLAQTLYPSILIGNSKSGYLAQSFFTKQLASLSVYTNLFKSTVQSKVSNTALWCGLGFLGHSANSYFTRDLNVFSKYNSLLSNLSKKAWLDGSILFSHRLEGIYEQSPSENDVSIKTVKFVTHKEQTDVSVNQLRLPLKTFFEKKAVFVNLEGRTQLTKPSTYAPGTVGTMDVSSIYFKAIFNLPNKMHVQDSNPPTNWTFEDVLLYKNTLCPDLLGSLDYDIFNLSTLNYSYSQDSYIFHWDVDDFVAPNSRSFYMNDVVSKNSFTMSKCEAGLLEVNFLKTPSSY